MDTNSSSPFLSLLSNQYFHKAALSAVGLFAAGFGVFYFTKRRSSLQAVETTYLNEETLARLLLSIYNDTAYYGFNLLESTFVYQLDETNVVFKAFLDKRAKKGSGLTTKKLIEKLSDFEKETVLANGIPIELYLKSIQHHLPKSQLYCK